MMPWVAVLWVAVSLPNLCASSVIARSSSTLKAGRSWNELRACYLPVAVIFRWSAPSLINCRAIARHSFSPVTSPPK